MHHQRLHCVGVLMEAARLVPALVRRVPKGNAFLDDELKRALASAILNITEGNARTSTKEKARFFDVAIASIAESASAVALLAAYGAVTDTETAPISELLRVSYAMSINLKKSVIRKPGTDRGF